MDFIFKINTLHIKWNSNGTTALVQNIGIPAFLSIETVFWLVYEVPPDSKLLVSYGGLWDCKGDEISPASAA